MACGTSTAYLAPSGLTSVTDDSTAVLSESIDSLRIDRDRLIDAHRDMWKAISVARGHLNNGLDLLCRGYSGQAEKSFNRSLEALSGIGED